MIITVQFKNRFKEFCGGLYDYNLVDNSSVPAVGDIIRMMDNDYNYICHATRVKVVDIKNQENNPKLASIRYVVSSMED